MNIEGLVGASQSLLRFLGHAEIDLDVLRPHALFGLENETVEDIPKPVPLSLLRAISFQIGQRSEHCDSLTEQTWRHFSTACERAGVWPAITLEVAHPQCGISKCNQELTREIWDQLTSGAGRLDRKTTLPYQGSDYFAFHVWLYIGQPWTFDELYQAGLGLGGTNKVSLYSSADIDPYT